MRQTAAFDGFASTYDAALNRGISLSGESKEYFVRRRIEWLSSRLGQQASRPRHVLDYGCGTGASARDLLEHLAAASVTGGVSTRMLWVVASAVSISSSDERLNSRRLSVPVWPLTLRRLSVPVVITATKLPFVV